MLVFVSDAPRCSHGYEVTEISATPFEMLALHCHVDASPQVEKFSWTYNSSTTVHPIRNGEMINEIGLSRLHIVPDNNEMESVSCWAQNQVGHQQVPCIFYIVPASKS